MTQLSFDVEAAKAQLTRLFRARLLAQGATYNLFNVDLSEVDFTDLAGEEGPVKVENSADLVAELVQDLAAAKATGQDWLNDGMPDLTAAAQAVIDYASRWDNAIPLVLAELRRDEPDRTTLGELFAGLASAAQHQVGVISPLATEVRAFRDRVATSAADFSRNHLPFRQLEDLDVTDLAAARTTIEQIRSAIAGLSEEIDLDMITAERDLAIASNAMKYGGKLGNPGKILGLTIGLVFIVSATFAIDDLLSAVDARLAQAQEEADYQLEMTLLTAQLISLEVASGALATLTDQVGELVDALDATLTGWRTDAAELAAVVGALDSSAPVSSVVNLFDLGQTQAEWSELATFATKWQTMEVASRPANAVVLEPVGGAS